MGTALRRIHTVDELLHELNTVSEELRQLENHYGSSGEVSTLTMLLRGVLRLVTDVVDLLPYTGPEELR